MKATNEKYKQVEPHDIILRILEDAIIQTTNDLDKLQAEYKRLTGKDYVWFK
jgi:hypothetical protein